MAEHSVSATRPELPSIEPAWPPQALGLTALHATFLGILALSVVWAWQPLTTIIGRSLKSSDYEHYSHIILLPFISAYLLYLKRDTILRQVHPSRLAGLILVAVGAATIWFVRSPVVTADTEYRLAGAMLGVIAMWVGGFVISYGVRSLRVAAFPFAVLVFMIPLPPAALTAIIVFLQKGSADASEVLFSLIRMPAFRDDFTFSLPGMTIRVAEECSGIRSSLALMISGLLMAYLLLRTTWTRIVLVLLIIPLSVVKNAVRIVALSWLGVYVDPSFITGHAVHRNGGIPIFLMSLMILGGIAWLLQRCERPGTRRLAVP